MKTTLILAAFTAALSVAATQSFAQNFVNYPSPYGNSHPTIIARTPTPIGGSKVTASAGRLTASDFGYQAAPAGPMALATTTAVLVAARPASAQSWQYFGNATAGAPDFAAGTYGYHYYGYYPGYAYAPIVSEYSSHVRPERLHSPGR
jgi:hypothetical protein